MCATHTPDSGLPVPARLAVVLDAARRRGVAVDVSAADTVTVDSPAPRRLAAETLRLAAGADGIAHDAPVELSAKSHRVIHTSGRPRLDLVVQHLPHAIVARPGHTLVEVGVPAIEVAALAVLSGDPVLTAATAADDPFSYLAEQLPPELGATRSTAKTALFRALYTTADTTVGDVAALHATVPAAVAFAGTRAADGTTGMSLVHRAAAAATYEAFIAAADALAEVGGAPVLLAFTDTLVFEVAPGTSRRTRQIMAAFTAPATTGIQPRVHACFGSSMADLAA